LQNQQRLYSRLIVESLAPSFDHIRYRCHDSSAFLAFDLMELNGDDLRRDPFFQCREPMIDQTDTERSVRSVEPLAPISSERARQHLAAEPPGRISIK
jgi:ATP-dependent DNA ligase